MVRSELRHVRVYFTDLYHVVIIAGVTQGIQWGQKSSSTPFHRAISLSFYMIYQPNTDALQQLSLDLIVGPVVYIVFLFYRLFPLLE